jgi:hypothetical protein
MKSNLPSKKIVREIYLQDPLFITHYLKSICIKKNVEMELNNIAFDILGSKKFRDKYLYKTFILSKAGQEANFKSHYIYFDKIIKINVFNDPRKNLYRLNFCNKRKTHLFSIYITTKLTLE